jgi:hypothetical protein
MTALRGDHFELHPLAETAGQTRPLDLSTYSDVASVFFG